ncbi:hypothetical protein H5410_026040 [Solanum commersonii]|uniref:SANT domain-containing protein n=1 Tax=Solanum commersonii TaxID=4109 RepID=A0A9J5YZP3_SOLCO|nr:hypothetical protein H5410_026040 [Solanum commersonii]
MSTKQTCYSSFWTRDEDKIFENTLVIYSKDINLLTKIQEALRGKSLDDILDHYNILVEDVKAIESGLVPLPNYPKMQEHQCRWLPIPRSFQAPQCHNKRNRKPRAKASVLDITSVDVEVAGTSQVRNTVDMIGHACRGSQTLPTTNNESMLPGERTNAEQMIAVAGGESSDHNVALINGMKSLFPYAYDEFIIGIDDLIMEQEDVNEPEKNVVAPAQLPPGIPSSSFGTVGDKGFFDLDDLFPDQV